MGSSPEMESFGISDADYEYMYNPLKKSFKQSKKQQIYGVFASDDSGSDDERTGFGGRNAGFNRKGANYSAPITFVSGGVKLGEKDAVLENELDAVDQISDEDDDTGTFQSLRNYRDTDSDSSMESSATRHPGRRMPNFEVGAGRRAAVAASLAKGNASGFGAWERHTKGIGMKLLEQMGYEPGKGLGSEGQGIITPVQAVQRVGKAAVGFFGSEKAPIPRRGDEPVIQEKTSEHGGPRYKKKSGAATPSQKLKHFDYKSAEELVANLCPATPAASVRLHGLFLENSEMSKVKVIDMTSKEQKVYSGYKAALSRVESHQELGSDEANEDAESIRRKKLEGQFFDCPAFRHNFALILKSTEDEIRKLDRIARYEEDHAVGLEHEIEKLTEVIKSESVEVKKLRTALDLIKDFEVELSCIKNSIEGIPCITSDNISSWMSRIRVDCADLAEMPALMAVISRPLLDDSLARWDPLKEPTYCLDLLSRWRDIFQNASAFHVILETTWLSALRRAVVNDWDPRDCESLLDVLEAWRFLLPDELLDQKILNQLVLPKLQEAVSLWNPLTDTVPIHTWLHPWLPWFGAVDRLAFIHETVLQKLGSCLTNWHPSDGSAYSVLIPWRSVFSSSAMTAFLNRHIVPKLSLVLQQFQLNPSNQNMDPWNWVMRWTDLIGAPIIVNLLEQHFWSRWLSILSNWLSQGLEARQRGDPNGAAQVYQEVGRWYAGWKGQLPPECMEYASVKDALTKALAMMERSMRGLPPRESEPSRPSRSVDSPGFSVPPMQTGLSHAFGTSIPMVAQHPTTLRKQVEQVAAQRGLLFHPITNRFYEGQQVYRLESLQVFFDRNVSFVYNPCDGGWHPVPFVELISRAQS